MFIGHLPGAYVALNLITPQASRVFMTAALVGSVLPDVDMLWFYLVDGRQTHHHDFITHRPAVWALLGLIGLLWPAGRAVLTGLAIGGLIHMALDSIVGSIAWAWPVSTAAHPLVVVPASQDWWVMSFVLHWTFAVELVLCALAVTLWITRRKRQT